MNKIEIKIGARTFEVMEVDLSLCPDVERFTEGHSKFGINVHCKTNKIGNQNYNTVYQCNTKYIKFDLREAFNGIVRDADCYRSASKLEDFLEEFGYLETGQSAVAGIRAHEACEKAYNFLTDDRTYTFRKMAEYLEEQDC